MAEISQNVNIEMLEKLPDGTYKRKYPKTRADDGTTFDEHLADYTQHVDDETAHGIGNKSLLETNEKGTIVGAVNELFTSVSNGKSLVGRAITDVDDSVVIPTGPTFQELANAIGGISTELELTPGDNVLVSALTDSSSNLSYWSMAKQIKVNYGGVVRVSFDLQCSGVTPYEAHGQIYKNGSPVGIPRINSTTSYITYTEDIGVKAGDNIQLYRKVNSPAVNVRTRNFYIRANEPVIANVTHDN